MEILRVYMKHLIAALLLVLPWPLRRIALVAIFRYKIHPSASIGLSIVCPQQLEMGAGARIGHLTICKGIELLKMDDKSFIGNLNWITGFPAGDQTFFSADVERRPVLILRAESSVTNRHFLDCTNSVQIGRFTTFAGIHSQILTHSIDLYQCRQSSKPVTIGEYCFVGTGSVLLGGCVLPDYSVLGAGSLLNKEYTDPYFLYGGNPARPIKSLPKDMAYFNRSSGFVH